MESISVQEAYKRMQSQGLVLLDVRTPAEFREAHAESAINLPLDKVTADAMQETIPNTEGKTVAVICGSEKRSAIAIEKLNSAGSENLINVEGGTRAWIDARLPHKTGKASMSLERQVRVAAGSMVATGCVLGFLLNPAFYLLALFIGAGLIFSGITDTCGMGVVLAKMPWNR